LFPQLPQLSLSVPTSVQMPLQSINPT
jgi:hypothetical protein